MLQLTDAGAQAVLNASVGHHTAAFDGGWYGSVLMLFTNSPTLGPKAVKANLTEPTYTAYAEQVMTWNAPVRQPDTSLAINSQTLNIPGTSDTTTSTITGYGILGADSATLLGAEMFPQPIPIIDPLSGFGIVAQLSINAPGNNNGSATVIE